MTGRGIKLIGRANTVRTVDTGGGTTDFRNVVEALLHSSAGEVLVIDAGSATLAVVGKQSNLTLGDNSVHIHLLHSSAGEVLVIDAGSATLAVVGKPD